MAVLASLRGYLDIENWLPNVLCVYKDLFAEVIYSFHIQNSITLIPVEMRRYLTCKINVFHVQECLKFVKNVHFSESEDFTSQHFHPSDPLSDVHLDATTSLLKVS